MNNLIKHLQKFKIYRLLKKQYYILLDAVTFGKGITVSINNFKIKFPTKYYRLFTPDYEWYNFNFFKKHYRQGMTSIDIGAHIGLWAVYIAKMTKGKVYSFEPTPSTVKILNETVRLNKCENQITVIQAAVSGEPGTATFHASDFQASAINSLLNPDTTRDEQFGEDNKRLYNYEVDVVSIDDFVKQKSIKIDFLKIDCEGVEEEVLIGAKETFLRDRPFAILGLHPFAYESKQEKLGKIWDILESYKMQMTMNAHALNKADFCTIKELVFDVQLLPQETVLHV